MEPAPARVFAFGDFRLDASSRRLLRAGEAVPLTPKVFDTLLYLVEHRGAVLGRDELLAALWPDVVVEENNLGQAISKLRQALGEAPGDNRYIVTVPGRGYRFAAHVTLLPVVASPDRSPAVTVPPQGGAADPNGDTGAGDRAEAPPQRIDGDSAGPGGSWRSGAVCLVTSRRVWRGCLSATHAGRAPVHSPGAPGRR
jgi:DNA-binding winged helix-turn-helix (wHTH) protein